MTGNWIQTGSDSSRLQSLLRTAISELNAAASNLVTLKNIMAQMVVNSDYTTIETIFNLQAGQGQTLHDVLGSASDDLQGTLVQGLLQRFG